MDGAEDGADSAPPACPRCGGQLVAGRLGNALLGSSRFTVRIGTTEVGTDVAARMCEDCGHVELTAKDPQSVTRAARARSAIRTAARPDSRRT